MRSPALSNPVVLPQVRKAQVIVNAAVLRPLQRKGLLIARFGCFIIPAPEGKIAEKKRGGDALRIRLDCGLVLLAQAGSVFPWDS